MTVMGLFVVEKSGHTLIVTPLRDPDELTFDELEGDGKEMFELLMNGEAKHVVVDCSKIDRCCSTALGFFVKLWKRVRDIDGRMAFCNMSTHMRCIVELTHLGQLWALCDTREQALAEVEKQG
jgi:anti-anti-sigma factor